MADTATLESVAEGVNALSDAVARMQDDQLTKADVQQIAEGVLEEQKAAAAEINKGRGVGAEDVDDERSLRSFRSAEEKLQAILTRPAAKIAPVIRRPVADVEEFQARADDLLMLGAALGKDPRKTRFYSEEYLPAFRAAMDTATSGEGAEWVPTELSSSMIERVNLPLMVAAVFPMIQMPTDPYEIPASGVTRRRSGKFSEQTADTGQDKFKAVTPGTRKVQLSTIMLAARALVSRKAEEDTIVPMLPFMQEELGDYLAADIEDASINGDLTGTHMDSDVSDSDDPRRSWNGLRDIALNGLTGASRSGSDTKISLATLRANRKLMGKYGIRPGELVHIVSMAGYIDLLDDTSLLTLDKYGQNATVMAGELAKADGAPVIVSEYVSDYQNASGVIDGETETQTSAITVNRRGFFRGERRGVTVQILRELYAESDQDGVVISVRQDFKQRYPASENAVALTYNLPGSG